MSHHGINPIGDHPLFKKMMAQAEKAGNPLKDAQRCSRRE